MIEIGASLLNTDLSHLADTVQRLDEGGVDFFHIDMMDGHFVPQLTFGPAFVEAIRPHTEKLIDVHLMVDEPESYIADLANAGADHVTFHIEATKHVHRVIELITEYDLSAGIALNPGTPVMMVEPILDQVAMVLQMSVDPGYGGQRMIRNTYRNVQQLRMYRDEYHLNYQIQMDGGINESNLDFCQRIGADMAVVGSGIIKQKDWQQAINGLKKHVLTEWVKG